MPNVHTFPLAAYPGLAPELAVRSGQGGWDAFAVPTPADRLLPFVLSRPAPGTQGRWVNCAVIVDADTGTVLETLVPTGLTAGAPPLLGLVLEKVPDPKQGVEHFVYYGALIPGLALPCGRPLRLLLDNAWQSPRFQAHTDLSGYQRLEWTHPGPLAGVPYGMGLVQRLYVPNGGLQYATPRTVQTSTQDATSGALRTDFTAEYARRTTTAGPYPGYLLDALSAAKAHKSFAIDGEPWRLIDTKDTASGPDGGRAVLTLTVEALDAVQGRAACPPPPLPPLAYDPALDAPRGWRCGDAGDTAPDFVTYQRTCAEAGDGSNSGLVNWSQRDENPRSATFGTTRSVLNAETDTGLCPIPPTYYSEAVSGTTTRDDCPDGQAGTAVYLLIAAGQFSSRDSQAEANQAARDYFAATRQADANARGTCAAAPSAGSYFPIFQPNGCFSRTMQNAADPTDVRAATTAEWHQYGCGFGCLGLDGAECP